MKIITDSGSMMSQTEAEALGVELIPLQVEVNGKNFRDYFEISSESFVQMIRSAVPNSSQPAIGEVIGVFERTRDALYIAMTKGLSSTYDSAAGIQQQSEFKDITVFNSGTLAGPQKYLVELAARLVNNHTKQEIIDRLEVCLSSCQSFLMPVDFDFLKRNGRLSGIAAMMSGLLKIKPIVFHLPGMLKLEKFGVSRTWSQAVDSVIDKMIENQVDMKHKIYISHALNKEVAEQFRARIQARMNQIETEILALTPVMITQGGPGCVAIQYILKDEMA